MKKTALTLTLVLPVLFSALSIAPVKESDWSTIQVPTPNNPYISSITYDGNTIAFSTRVDGDAEIFVVNWDGTGLTQVTNDSRINIFPQISWDGTKIAFQSYVEYYLGGGDPFRKDYRIFVVNSDGTGLIEIARDCGIPSLSGDGSKIAFQKSNQLYVVNSDGTDLTQLTNKTVVRRPSISGDGKKIAFVSESHLFVVNSDGKELTSLFTAREIGTPNICGDGKKITFYADLNGAYDLFVVNSDGTELTKLASNIGLFFGLAVYHDIYYPSISADGSRIAFASKVSEHENEIFVINSDGTELKQIPSFTKQDSKSLSISGDGSKILFRGTGYLCISVNSDRILSDLASEDDTDSPYVADRWGPPIKIASKVAPGYSVSGDGEKIAFISKLDGDSEIFVVNSDGTELKQLTNNTIEERSLTMDGDGSRIAFYASTGDNSYALYVINSDGTGLRLIANDLLDWANPSMSGDGSKIAFKRYRADEAMVEGFLSSKIFVVNSDGTGLTQLTNDSRVSSYIQISHDGSKVVFTSDDRMFIINSDGTELKQIFEGSWDIGTYSSISSDGERIAFVSDEDEGPEIFVINSDGTVLSSPTKKLPYVIYALDPPSISDLHNFLFLKMSGDGDKLAFISGYSSGFGEPNGTTRWFVNRHLFVVNSDGTELTKLTNTTGDYWEPFISNDGSKVVFSSRVSDLEYDLYLSVNSDLMEKQQSMEVQRIVTAFSVVVVAFICVCLLVYFKKRKH